MLVALPGIPLVKPGDDLVSFIIDGLRSAELELQPHDVVVVTSKIVAKAENRWLDLRTVMPSDEARRLGEVTGKDPRLVEAILQESQTVSRYRQGVLIVRHRLGFISANAGIDRSNIGPKDEDRVLLLPQDPDQSARRIREGLLARTGVAVGVILSDTHGRPFRVGNVGTAIGIAGIPALLDLRGHADLFGRELKSTIVAVADAIAAAAGLVSGEADEGRPVVLVRGLVLPEAQGCSADLNRDPEFDLYQ
ncbi:MAG: coenzyme F420-0:L-glutamate ligase [Anaerolineae bacterium]|nr:coenzyme F420-0:L-glutamate ligase [Anaerolineae bacterium]